VELGLTIAPVTGGRLVSFTEVQAHVNRAPGFPSDAKPHRFVALAEFDILNCVLWLVHDAFDTAKGECGNAMVLGQARLHAGTTGVQCACWYLGDAGEPRQAWGKGTV
jgi:hypothetical protein